MEWLREALNGVVLAMLVVLIVAIALVAILARRAARIRRDTVVFDRMTEQLAASGSLAERTELLFDTIFKAFAPAAAALYVALSPNGPLLLQAKRLKLAQNAKDPEPDPALDGPVPERAPPSWEPRTRLDEIPPGPRIAHHGLAVLSLPIRIDSSALALVQMATVTESDARRILKRADAARSLLAPVLSQLALGERIRRLEDEIVTAAVVSSASQTLLNATLDLENLGRLLLDLAIRVTESDAGLILLARDVAEPRRSSILATDGFETSHVQTLLDEFDRHGRLPIEERATVDTVAPHSEAHALLGRLGFPALLYLPIGPASGGAFLLARRVGAFQDRHVRICRLEVDRLTLSLKNRAFHEAIFNEYKATLEAMVATHEATSPQLRGHSDRVAGLVGDLAEAMGRPPAEVEGIRLAGRLHDIGMIGLGGEIVQKPGRLTPQEYDLVKHHPTIGAALITPIHLPIPIAPLVLHHHERHDGLGYPGGLKGLEIPLGARLLALAEVFDAMLTPRSYREALFFEDGRQRIRSMAGTQLDPATVEVFLQAITNERWQAIVTRASR